MDNLTTLSHRIFVVRQESDENGPSNADGLTILDLTTSGDFASKPSTAVDLLAKSAVWAPETERLPSSRPLLVQNGIEIYFSGGSEAGKTFTWKLYAWRNENGPAKYVATGTGELGTQALVKYPHNSLAATDKFWADDIDITWENWPKKVESTDTAGNSNSVGSVWLDAAGYRYWYMEIADADGSAGEAGDIAVWYGYW
ncbi:MAG: hypothetical protein KAS32_10775 [Candidatus Peribacteraceae bacterium]|nr:hypothetical protein [Candidatus Peribacteraceae bacterium]